MAAGERRDRIVDESQNAPTVRRQLKLPTWDEREVDTDVFPAIEVANQQKFLDWVSGRLNLRPQDLTDVGVYVSSNGDGVQASFSHGPLGLNWWMCKQGETLKCELYSCGLGEQEERDRALLDRVGEVLSAANWRGGNILPILKERGADIFANIGVRFHQVLKDDKFTQVVRLSSRGENLVLKVINPPDVWTGTNATIVALGISMFGRWLALQDRDDVVPVEVELTEVQRMNLRTLIPRMSCRYAMLFDFLPEELPGGVRVKNSSGLLLPQGLDYQGEDKPFEVRYKDFRELHILDPLTSGMLVRLRETDDSAVDLVRGAESSRLNLR